MFARFLGIGAIALAAGAAQASILVTAEAPGVQNTTAGFTFVGVETFDGRAIGTNQTFTSDFGGSAFSGTYTGVEIRNADQFGGANGTPYAVTFTTAGYTLDLSTTLDGGVNYFGFWLSALDRQNQLKFFKGADLVFTFSSQNAYDFINGQPNAADYYCNPNPPADRVCHEPYAFLNFYGLNGTTFDRIMFFQDPQSGGYESDNHTVGQWTRITGDPVAVPEPASWAMLIAGFGLVGAASRRRKAVVSA